jgi:phosphohistidine phosphatase
MKHASSSRDRRGGSTEKTLWLLRHAKAVIAESDMDDFDRPLERRGRDAAARIGRHLARRGLRPDLVLCSPSARTRETLELVADALGGEIQTQYAGELYLAEASDLLGCLEKVTDDAGSVMLVGHNPGIAELAAELARRGDPEPLEAMRRKFPTGALAELRPVEPRWNRLGRGCELVSFVTPKRLDS